MNLLKIFFEIFNKMNQVKGFTEEVTVTTEVFKKVAISYSSDDVFQEKFARLTVSPENLLGMTTLWNLFLSIDSDFIAEELLDFIIPFYVKPLLDKQKKISEFRQFQREFLEKCENKVSEITSAEKWGQDDTTCTILRRILYAIEKIAKQTEIYGLSGDPAISCLCKGEQVNLKVENKMVATWENAKLLDIKLFGNETVFDLKKKLSIEERNVSWNNLKLTGKDSGREILDSENGTCLRLLKFKLNEKILMNAKPQMVV